MISETPKEVAIFEEGLSNLISQYNDANTKFEAASIPPTRPPSIFDESAKPYINWDDIERYKIFWKASGRDPQVLEYLLNKITLVTPEFEKRAFDFCAEEIENQAKTGTQIAIIGTGGRGQEKTFSHPAIVDLKTRYPNILFVPEAEKLSKLTVEKERDLIATIISHLKQGQNPTLILLDDWSFSGIKANDQLSRVRFDIEYYSNSSCNPHTKIIAGGITQRAIKDYDLEAHEYSAYYGIPLVTQLYDSHEYEKLLRNLYRGSMAKVLPLFGYHHKGLTIAYDRIPDSYCFPSVFTSHYTMLTDSSGKPQFLFDYFKGRKPAK